MAPKGDAGRQSATRRAHRAPSAYVVDERRLGRGRRRSDDYAQRIAPQALERAALATIDKLSRGVFLLDAHGTVTFANRAARAMAARDDGMLLRRQRLGFACESAQAAFGSFLSDSRQTSESLVLCARGNSESCPYRVLVSRLDDGSGYSVFVYEPNGGQKPLPVKVLRHLYRLTAAEARLANELFKGNSLAEAAEACGVSINTAKYTLKNVFRKCEIRSRAELMLLLSLGPRTL